MIISENSLDFDKKMDVVSCFIIYQNRHLLLKRQPHKTAGQQWGPPAGKVDSGETLEQAICREISEETELSIPKDQLSYFDSVNVRHGEIDFIYHMFSATLSALPAVTLSKDEHLEFAWTSPKEALDLDSVEDQDYCVRKFYSIF